MTGEFRADSVFGMHQARTLKRAPDGLRGLTTASRTLNSQLTATGWLRR
jgi:hypothetical protein